MSVPFSELTKKLKSNPDDEIALLYGFLGDFRRPRHARDDSEDVLADFKNFTPTFGPDKKEISLRKIQAHRLGKGGYPAALLIIHEPKKKQFRTLAVINVTTASFETDPHPWIKNGCSKGCLTGLIGFALFGIPATYMMLNHDTGVIGLALGAIAVSMLIFGPIASGDTDQKQYQEEVRIVCRALTKDQAYANVRNRYNDHKHRFEQNSTQNNQTQGFVDVDLDS